MPEVFVAKILREIANKGLDFWGLDFRLPERRKIQLGKFHHLSPRITK